MQSPDRDASPSASLQTLPAAHPAVRSSKVSVPEGRPLSQSEVTLPYRRPNPSTASLFASTQTPPGSRSISPSGRASPARSHTGSVLGGAGGTKSLADSAGDNPGDLLNLLLKSFVPHVAIYTSEETAEFARGKGFKNGLWELLRPFGEKVQGKVTIRDSNGLSRTWEDFAIRFVRLGDDLQGPDLSSSGIKGGAAPTTTDGLTENAAQEKQRLEAVESVVDRHLQYAEHSMSNIPHQGQHFTRQGLDIDAASPYYSLYIRRLLSGIPVSPHETFSHPVACVIAISSQSKSPIEELRTLYNETRQGDKKLPEWVDGEYLRYYVLVHDEERDDITRSLSLFEQMKRHLGLHCHLLRLRSSQSAETDDDSIPLPRSDWMTAEEELADLRKSEDDEDFEDPTRHIFESDATAIRTFVREMVTQSVIPTMERHVAIWNDQVASRRRGFAGRFMNLSRKWGGFGGSSRSSIGAAGSDASFESLGYYPADSSEAIMRKMADYCFMLRDWKLAQSTYDLLRSDFGDAKAWRYHAASNEMAAVSLLIMAQNTSSKSRAEALDQMLESAFYSYHTRCSAPFGALRSLTLGFELLRLQGGSNIDKAASWASRLLESRIPGPIADALLKERLAICYASKVGAVTGSLASWGTRTRKAGFWAVLGAEAWVKQSKYIQAQRCLNEAQRLYTDLGYEKGEVRFALAGEFVRGLQRHVDEGLQAPLNGSLQGSTLGVDQDEGPVVDEESEALDGGEEAVRTRRASRVVAATASLETAPLHDVPPPLGEEEAGEKPSSAQDDFG
ncbi:hypothetical protein ACRALDRAFT_1059211 [Sodiomyces alcalophilus JCM 7366]|uniref:uncharacterized protein n=1 Tax=Sodiomyces alcalophilus JCM 7366 TaxID=591952 RepID=UPI0039B42C17